MIQLRTRKSLRFHEIFYFGLAISGYLRANGDR